MTLLIDLSTSTKYIWYLAYGSNMSSSVLVGRRGIQPFYSFPCHCSKLRLNFGVPGLPYIEPGFGSVTLLDDHSEKKNVNALHGVAYLITVEDYQKIRETEGGGGHDDYGYKDLDITCTLYKSDFFLQENEIFDTTKTKFYDKEESLGKAPAFIQSYIHKIKSAVLNTNNSNNPLLQVHCRTLIVHGKSFKLNLKPSKRYLGLLQDGALEHGLQRPYREWLQYQVPYYQCDTVMKRVGKCVYLLGFSPCIIVVISCILLRLNKSTFFNMFVEKMSRFSWFLHDRVYSRVFGSGSE